MLDNNTWLNVRWFSIYLYQFAICKLTERSSTCKVPENKETQTRIFTASYWCCCHGPGLYLQCHFFLKRTWCHCLRTSWVMGCAHPQPQGDRTWSLKKRENSPWAVPNDCLETEGEELRSSPQSWRERRTEGKLQSKSERFRGRERKCKEKTYGKKITIILVRKFGQKKHCTTNITIEQQQQNKWK